MRRITFAVVSTLALLVLLFSYRTSTGSGGSVSAQQVSAARVVAGAAPSAGSGATTGQGPDPAAADRGSATTTATATTTVTVTRGSTGGSGSATTGTSTPETAATPSGPATSTTPAPARSTAAGSTTKAASQPITVDGASEMTRYGIVQVRVVITGSTITDVTAVQYPQTERRDQEINSVAIPELRNQVLSAQSANVQGVSGATYTTEGYLGSLQSALDAAGFKS